MRSNSGKAWLTALAPAILVGLAAASRPALAEHTFEVVKRFELPDRRPSALVLGSDGALYGTTASGGPFNQGSFFRLEADGTFSVLYSFDGTEGSGRSGLVLGRDGAFYGTTASGGSFWRGSVFRFDAAGILTTLHSFDGGDGEDPSPFLVAGSDGALYGTTRHGGLFGYGTVFRIDSRGSFASLHSFSGSDGANPDGPLTLGSDGALYGIIQTLSGSFWVGGAVFRIDAAGTFTTVYSSDAADFRPNGPLTLGSDGALYGTLPGLCIPSPQSCLHGWGSVFRIDSTGSLTTVHSFSFASDVLGLTPRTPLVLGSDGSLYGTTAEGGAYGGGTAFRINNEGNFWVLRAFRPGPPHAPTAAAFLVAGNDGAVYGTRGFGNAFKVDGAGRFTGLPFAGPAELVVANDGAIYGSQDSRVFRIDNAGTFTELYSFPLSPDGADPQPALALGGDGAIYGATHTGTLFKVDSAGTFDTLHAFVDEEGSAVSSFVRGGDGAVYGLTQPGVFKIDGEGTFSSLHPSALGVFPDGNGTLYGFDSSTVFRIDGAGNVTTLFDFASDPEDPFYGRHSSITALALGSDGALYGNRTRVRYVPCECSGEVYSHFFFRIDAAGVLTDLLSDWRGASALVRGSDGAFYGTTYDAIFRIDVAGTLTTVHAFTGSDGSGASPALVLGQDGALYGTTAGGGASHAGTVFKLDAAGNFTSLHSFSGEDGTLPRDVLLLGSDGSLYGTTAGGGASGAGTVFRIDQAGTFASLYSYGTDYDFSSGSLVVANDCSLYGTAGGGPSAAGIVYRLFEARHPCQHIEFETLPDRSFGEPPFAVSATASSRLPVSLRASGPCSVSGDRVTLTGVGRCTLTASQGGDADYEPAPEVTRTFDVRSAACFDGLDNDSDGSTDFGSDPDCSSAVDTNENAAPVAICRDVVLAAGAESCGASAAVDGGSSDPDGHELDVEQSPAGPYALGTTPVTLRVTDPFGAESACPARVTVVDETPPTIDCGPAMRARRKGVVPLPWSATDACGAVVTRTTPPTCFVVKKNGRRLERKCSLLSPADLTFRKLPKPKSHVAWTVTARDVAGNETTRHCETVIGKPR